MLKFLLSFLLILTIQGCANLSIVNEAGYGQMAKNMPAEFTKRNLPINQADYASSVVSSKEPYGQILFNQLSPTFMQGQMAQYYIGETFADTMQARRSTVKHNQNGFEITHVSQIIEVKMIAIADWNHDGDKEWIVTCKVTPRNGGHVKTWFLLVPPPRNSSEILQGTPCAIQDCLGTSCTMEIKDSHEIARTKIEETIPKTEVNEFRPGEATVTTPPENATKDTSTVQERSI